MTTPEDLLRFWFGDSVTGEALLDAHVRRWFARDASFDHLVRDRFTQDIERASRGDLDAWKGSARGRLALIILLDQLPRNAFRDSAEAYAFDRHAVELCLEGLAIGADLQLLPIERQFFYLPLLHSERRSYQQLSVRCFERLLAQSPAAQAAHFAAWVRVARRSCRIVEWFGRFPHRNPVLGRKPKPAERAFLAGTALFNPAAKAFSRWRMRRPGS